MTPITPADWERHSQGIREAGETRDRRLKELQQEALTPDARERAINRVHFDFEHRLQVLPRERILTNP